MYRAIDRKNAFPGEAGGIPSTYTQRVIRAASGTLQEPRLWCQSWGRGREASKKGRASCLAAERSPKQGGPGAVKGKGRGGDSPDRAEAAV